MTPMLFHRNFRMLGPPGGQALLVKTHGVEGRLVAEIGVQEGHQARVLDDLPQTLDLVLQIAQIESTRLSENLDGHRWLRSRLWPAAEALLDKVGIKSEGFLDGPAPHAFETDAVYQTESSSVSDHQRRGGAFMQGFVNPVH